MQQFLSRFNARFEVPPEQSGETYNPVDARMNVAQCNRFLMDTGNWPYFQHDSVGMPGEVGKIVFEGNFVDSDDGYLDPDDTWREHIPYTITLEDIRLEAKSRIDGPYDLMVTLTTSN